MIYSLLSDSAESNSYIVAGEKAAVIDAGILSDRVLNHNREYNISTEALINTHCHFDHVGANSSLLKTGDIEVFCHKWCAEALEGGMDERQLASLFGRDPIVHNVDVKLKEGDTIDLGDVFLDVFETPGHTPGGICLYEPESKGLFTGDTVFVGSIGRYDFLGGSFEQLEASVLKLCELVEDSGVDTIYPGHGPTGVGSDILDVFRLYFS